MALIEERRTKYYKMLEIFTEAEVDSNNMECLSQQIWIYKQQREYTKALRASKELLLLTLKLYGENPNAADLLALY